MGAGASGPRSDSGGDSLKYFDPIAPRKRGRVTVSEGRVAVSEGRVLVAVN